MELYSSDQDQPERRCKNVVMRFLPLRIWAIRPVQIRNAGVQKMQHSIVTCACAEKIPV
jgi:hypothetical protein